MERLTIRLQNGVIKRTEMNGDNRGENIMSRLAAYEDLGLKPDEIAEKLQEFAKLQEATRWVPVTERLPEVGKCFLLRQTYNPIRGERGEYEEVSIGYLYQPTDKRRKPFFYWAAVSNHGDMVRAESICPGCEYITHWRPMPQPPKGDT